RRHHEPRLRRGGAPGPRAMVDLARVRPRGKLGGDTRVAARGDAARPPLVSGQSPAPAAVVHRGNRARTPRAVPERDLLVRLRGALARVPDRLLRRGGAVVGVGTQLLPRRAQPVPDLARVAAGALRGAVRLGVRGAPAAEGAGLPARGDPAP